MINLIWTLTPSVNFDITIMDILLLTEQQNTVLLDRTKANKRSMLMLGTVLACTCNSIEKNSSEDRVSRHYDTPALCCYIVCSCKNIEIHHKEVKQNDSKTFLTSGF